MISDVFPRARSHKFIVILCEAIYIISHVHLTRRLKTCSPPYRGADETSQLRRCIAPAHLLINISEKPVTPEGRLGSTYIFLRTLPFSSSSANTRSGDDTSPALFDHPPSRILRRDNRWVGRCDGRGQKRPSRQKVIRAASCHPIEVYTPLN